jgi:pyruvate dehydrogenase E1 component alpha subunit
VTAAPGEGFAAERHPVPDAEHGRHLLREMLRIRRFEERCVELYSAEKIRGFLHLYIGEEAVGVGVMQALQEADNVVGTYREHGLALARGVSAGSIMAEMYGKQEGCSRGRGGSMHLFDVSRRFYGGNAIVGGGLPLAVGMALADKLQGRRRVTACFFGDGAVAEGEFHESMNLAALWQLPVLFCCENNYYAMGTALERHQAQTDLAVKAASYGMAAWPVDGMDVLAVEAAAGAAVLSVRESWSPVFLELRTYRFRAHSMYDPELYRSREEVERWKEQDPISSLTRQLQDAGMLSEAELAEMEAEVELEIEEAIEFAEAGSWEPVEELARFVHSEPHSRVTAPDAAADVPSPERTGTDADVDHGVTSEPVAGREASADAGSGADPAGGVP